MRELHKRFPAAARVMGVTTHFSGPFRSDVSWDPNAEGFAGHSPDRPQVKSIKARLLSPNEHLCARWPLVSVAY